MRGNGTWTDDSGNPYSGRNTSGTGQSVLTVLTSVTVTRGLEQERAEEASWEGQKEEEAED